MKKHAQLDLLMASLTTGNTYTDDGGVWDFPGQGLRVVASWGDGWDHVSVSRQDRTPTWEEMEWVRERFFRAEETAMQLSVPRSQHIDCHPFCLHWWRPQKQNIPMPPSWMVGPMSRTLEERRSDRKQGAVRRVEDE